MRSIDLITFIYAFISSSIRVSSTLVSMSVVVVFDKSPLHNVIIERKICLSLRDAKKNYGQRASDETSIDSP
jgi:hypothetical protein